ncbi:CerR family C-terminal domain-containing protein [Pseudomonas sp. dw_358]|uniref:CerR family C-terminal domain-containing protein n=1 Tax=Pseudomonas sp. dw_358 TaxID=2720083 RepID=UPI001BD357C6|nr:CerR family C-terminal domain-containing protein [Pseudomonas sp. dw_358]
MARHKPAAEGGYQRGEQTRARIIEAAVAVFGQRGYEGASTREIAAAAGVNAPALQYYFEGKEGVYLQCVEQMISLLWRQMGGTVDAAQRTLDDPLADDEQLIESVLGLLGAVISMLQDCTETSAWRAFMDRHQEGLSPPSASMLFEERFRSRMVEVIHRLIARLTGFDVKDERTVIHSLSLFAQGLAFRAQRPKLLMALKWSTIGNAEMELVREVVLTQARFTLEGLARCK